MDANKPNPEQENEANTVEQRLNQIESRVAKLEEEKRELKEENTKLRRAVSSLEENNARLRETIEEVIETTEDVEDTIDLLESRLDATVNRTDDVEERLQDLRERSERKRSDLAYRLSQLEDVLDLSVVEASTTDQGSGSVIEQFASLPDEVKRSELGTSKYRATLVYEKFEEWGTFTQKGYVLKSSDIKKLLSASEGLDLQYPQVYRVMEAFDEGTPPEFEYKQPDENEKLLVRYHDTSEARADAANTVVSDD